MRSTDISHTFTIDELEVDLSLPGGGGAPWVVIELVVEMPGTYLLYCRPHRDRGHVTTFEVTPGGATKVQTPAPPT